MGLIDYVKAWATYPTRPRRHTNAGYVAVDVVVVGGIASAIGYYLTRSSGGSLPLSLTTSAACGMASTGLALGIRGLQAAYSLGSKKTIDDTFED